ncbi:MAG TPA: phosphatidate cytidylyltransferase [Gemmataceae bacterium]
MLRNRLWMGSLLALMAAGVLVLDHWFAPWYPFLFACLLGFGALAGRELIALFSPPHRPPAGVFLPALLVLLAANWLTAAPGLVPPGPGAWQVLVLVFVAGMLALFLAEMARFREPGTTTLRTAVGVWGVAYIGLPASCVAQLRWLGAESGHGGGAEWWSLPLAIVFFVPKAGDVGAYVAGRLFGRTPFSPRLSPKKTWEGAAGGFAAAVATMLVLLYAGGGMAVGWAPALLFGAAVAVAAQLGDLAESMVKRDGHVKDSAHTLPGFGGVLDVIDSILFAAPVVYAGCLLLGVR